MICRLSFIVSYELEVADCGHDLGELPGLLLSGMEKDGARNVCFKNACGISVMLFAVLRTITP